jgi:hypothetical protein
VPGVVAFRGRAVTRTDRYPAVRPRSGYPYVSAALTAARPANRARGALGSRRPG